MGEIVSFEEHARRKARLQRVALNEAAVQGIWAREAGRRQWQLLWRTHPKRRRLFARNRFNDQPVESTADAPPSRVD